MITIEVDILNPKADKLLRDLEDMDLISIREISDNGFSKLADKLRSKAKGAVLSVNEITKEVETVRSKRYGKAKK